MKYEVVRKRIVRKDVTFEPGDEFEPTDAELNTFGDNLKKITGSSEEDSKITESSKDEICGAEMTDGDICERPAGECIYHEGK